MKVFILACFLTLFSSLSYANGQNQCGGQCVGTSGNPYYDAACGGASVNGQKACERYSGLGCVWTQKMKIPGRCIGTSGNPYYDAACKSAGINGQQACENYESLGCAWLPQKCK